MDVGLPPWFFLVGNERNRALYLPFKGLFWVPHSLQSAALIPSFPTENQLQYVRVGAGGPPKALGLWGLELWGVVRVGAMP